MLGTGALTVKKFSPGFQFEKLQGWLVSSFWHQTVVNSCSLEKWRVLEEVSVRSWGSKMGLVAEFVVDQTL